MNTHLHPLIRNILNTAAEIGSARVVNGELLVRNSRDELVRLGSDEDDYREKYDDRERVTSDEGGHRD